MASKSLITSGILAASIGCLWFTPALAQHQHHETAPHRHGAATHRQGFLLINPQGRHETGRHDHYRYVVPSLRQLGAFYTYENRHYYTPPAAPAGGGQRIAAQRPVAVEFGTFKHHDELAQRLETLANQLCLELHYNYQHNRGFQETYRESYRLLQTARFLHGSEHRGDHDAVRKAAGSLDNQFHHVQDDVGDWSRAERRRIGHFGLMAKLEEMEALIHHLLFDIGVKPDHDRDEEAPPPEDEAAPPPVGAPSPPFGGVPRC